MNSSSYGADFYHETVTSKRLEHERIVRDMVKMGPPIDRESGMCAFEVCGRYAYGPLDGHTAECPYRRAVTVCPEDLPG